jgi:sigma-B regulation protein RsbU (phosphoserine phosphatase)
LQLHLQEDTALQPMLEQVVAEIGAAWPARNLDSNLSVDAPVVCDRVKIGQLLSNLLANAMTHGAAGAPVSVAAATRDGGFALSVANGGPPIPQAAMDRLFQPFYRNSVLPTQQGLGLGLYIAAMIAEAHGGTLTVASSPVETRFTFRMPAQGEGAPAAH